MTNELAQIAEALSALRARDGGIDLVIKAIGNEYRVTVYEPLDAVSYARFGEADGDKFPVVYTQALNACRAREVER